MMDDTQRDPLLKIIDSVIDLDYKEKQEFVKILDTTRLTSVISTIKLLYDRLLVLNNLKQIVFNHSWKAGEVKHLQKIIENHYWIFGEEYRFICAEETKFDEALRLYRSKIFDDNKNYTVEHQDSKKEMDLFLAGRDYLNDNPRNLVVEIKNPTTVNKLTNKQTSQIESYMDVILKTDMFNSENEEWEFLLIGNDYDSIVERRIINPNTGLCIEQDKCKLYVRKWSDIINLAEKRIRFLIEKLQFERNKLSPQKSLDKAMELVLNSDNLN